jgi:hypothetical protein
LQVCDSGAFVSVFFEWCDNLFHLAYPLLDSSNERALFMERNNLPYPTLVQKRLAFHD